MSSANFRPHRGANCGGACDEASGNDRTMKSAAKVQQPIDRRHDRRCGQVGYCGAYRAPPCHDGKVFSSHFLNSLSVNELKCAEPGDRRFGRPTTPRGKSDGQNQVIVPTNARFIAYRPAVLTFRRKSSVLPALRRFEQLRSERNSP